MDDEERAKVLRITTLLREQLKVANQTVGQLVRDHHLRVELDVHEMREFGQRYGQPWVEAVVEYVEQV